MFRWLQLALPATSLQSFLLEVQLEILGLPKLLSKRPQKQKDSKKHNADTRQGSQSLLF